MVTVLTVCSIFLALGLGESLATAASGGEAFEGDTLEGEAGIFTVNLAFFV